MTITAAGRLVRKDNGEEVKIGDILDLNGEKFELKGWRRPHKPSSSGRVFVIATDDVRGISDFEKHFFPHVFDLEIVDFEKDW
jgi:hypothetical protein